MIRIYRKDDIEFKGYDRGKRIIGFSENLSERPKEYRERSLIELLTENRKAMYSLKQIKFDKEKRIYCPESFAVNYGAARVDSLPLARGFVPEGPWAQKQTLYEIMPRKKEIHAIPDPARRLFYEESKIETPNTFYFEGMLEDVLQEFRFAGFGIREFASGFDSLINPKNINRYFKEEGYEYIEEGLTLS